MSTTGAVVNKRVAASKQRRSDTRRIVYECEEAVRRYPSLLRDSTYDMQYRRAIGKVAYLARLNPTDARSLRARLDMVSPLKAG